MALAGRRCASPAGLNPERSVSEGTEEVPSSHRRRCAGARDLPASGVTRQAASVAAGSAQLHSKTVHLGGHPQLRGCNAIHKAR
eukprot:scaffold65_cov353-Prasinococcus_capsulatus_cf.AAC.15